MQGLLKLFKNEPTLPRLVDYDPVIRQVDDPEQVILPLDYPGLVSYHPVVEEGDSVRKGQVIAKSKSGHCVIASISGTVRIESVWTAHSVHTPAIIIDKGEGEPIPAEELFDGPVPGGDREAALERMRISGVVPPWVLSGREYSEEEVMPELPPVEAIVVTGVRQETTIVTSQLLLEQHADKVADGLKRLGEMLPEARIVMTAPESLRSWVGNRFNDLAEMEFLPPHFPERIEREVVARVLGRRIPNRNAYRFHGISVIDVEFLLAMVDALDGVAPFTQKCATISSDTMDKAITVRFPLGTPLEHILASQGLTVEEYHRTVVGGPMMGFAQYSEHTPVTYYNGIHLVTKNLVPFDAIAPCINCGRCARICPADIQVHMLNRMIEYGNLDQAQKLHPEACHECGLCAHVCPAERPIVQLLHFCNHEMVHGVRHTWSPGGES